MKYVKDIRIVNNMPGRYKPYICDIRFIDPAQGTYVNEHSMELYNWDKCVSFEGTYIASLLKRAEIVITEVLCS